MYNDGENWLSLDLIKNFIYIEDTLPKIENIESVGTKIKFWYDDKKYLFKGSRENTGEHLAEIVASQICNIIEIPHADYQLAIFKENIGVTTKNFVPSSGFLININELCGLNIFNNKNVKNYKKFEYTLSKTINC
ncbi:MAG: hypothetical protein IJU40_07775, partial [Desulfovibrionaceae bacterium]|nr:hypothetical protein [Desulfovibrionaceae bacterium]